jgi:RNA recognition motif-containing protein
MCRKNAKMKILVRNLDRETTDQELREAFAKFGKVQSATVVREKSNDLSKGFGFVEMPKPGDAKAAIKNLNNSKLGFNVIRVKYAESTSPAAKPPRDLPSQAPSDGQA